MELLASQMLQLIRSGKLTPGFGVRALRDAPVLPLAKAASLRSSEL
jgi:hypothetical protein